MKRKDLLLISNLRNNARETLTNMSKKIKMPISTIFDRLRTHQKGIIEKHTTLINFGELGFSTRATITVKVGKKQRDDLRKHLETHLNVNSVYKINNGYDFLVEVVFKGLKEMEEFIESLEEDYRIKTQVYYIIEDIKRESFLTEPSMIDLVV